MLVSKIYGVYVFDSYEMADTNNRAIETLYMLRVIESAKKEINIWFDENELLNYSTAQERFIYDIDIKNILQ